MGQTRSGRYRSSEAVSGAGSAGVAEERRRFPRQPVSWRVQLWLANDAFAVGHAVDASLRGIRIAASSRVGASLKVGAPYRLEVRADADVIACTAKLRTVGAHGIGFEALENLPLDLIDASSPVAE